MKRRIRQGVFETNSSSQHSLCIMKRDDVYTQEEFSDGMYLWKDSETGEDHCVWEPWERDLEFGRYPFRILSSFSEKWLYACASLVHEYNDAKFKELESIAVKYVDGLKKIVLPKISDTIPAKDDDDSKEDDYFQKYGKTEDELAEYLTQKEKEWNMEIDYWKTSSGYWRFEIPYTGYVDEDILSGFLEKEGITLEEYLINKKYIVIVDGDEYCYWGDAKKSGLINLDAIDHEY